MTDNELVERVVREVLRRLQAMGAAGTTRVAPHVCPAPSGGRELRLEERLVTLATIEGRLAGVAALGVRADAVVTPAVRDELRDRGITLCRGLT